MPIQGQRLAPIGQSEVVTAVDGASAGVAELSRPLDLVLMDMQKPKMDNLAATRAIRARVETQPRGFGRGLRAVVAGADL